MVMAVDFSKKIRALQEKHVEITGQMQKLLEQEDFGPDEEKKFDELNAQSEDLLSQIHAWEQRKNKAERLMEITGDAGGLTIPDPDSVRVLGPAWRDDPMCGFKSHREFFLAVKDAGAPSNRPARETNDDRLKFLATAGSDEQQTGSDPAGGYFIPKGKSTTVLTHEPEPDPVGPLTTKIGMGAPSIEIPARVDEDHSQSVTGGFVVGRRNETAAFTESRSSWKTILMKAAMLEGLTFATEELLADSPISVVDIINNGFRQAFGDKELEERIEGSGAGQFLGILNSNATIEIAKEGGQSANTIVGDNIIKMRQQCWRYGSAIWLANHDCLDQLVQTHIALTNTDVPLFAPGNGQGQPATLWGRPIFFSEYCKTLGTRGDLILAVWSEFIEGTYEPLQQAESMHVRFLEHERTFKLWKRNCGRPWWTVPLTPKNSTQKLSPFLVLEDR